MPNVLTLGRRLIAGDANSGARAMNSRYAPGAIVR